MPDENSWKIIENLLEHIAEHSNFYKNLLASKKVPIFRERLTMFLRERIVTRIDESGRRSHVTEIVKEDILIWYETSALIGTIVSWLQNDMPYTPTFLAKQFSLLHHRGAKCRKLIIIKCSGFKYEYQNLNGFTTHLKIVSVQKTERFFYVQHFSFPCNKLASSTNLAPMHKKKLP
ncbi:TetR-like C-terminal domain-containing protein [Peribacillus frigoritolerans]|nr:TetR-like C-terminal domain-containing protein [Peribacillus frigoritolerans]